MMMSPEFGRAFVKPTQFQQTYAKALQCMRAGDFLGALIEAQKVEQIGAKDAMIQFGINCGHKSWAEGYFSKLLSEPQFENKHSDAALALISVLYEYAFADYKRIEELSQQVIPKAGDSEITEQEHLNLLKLGELYLGKSFREDKTKEAIALLSLLGDIEIDTSLYPRMKELQDKERAKLEIGTNGSIQ